MPGGKPPCPCCWQHQVEVAAGQQLTVQECYRQLDAEAILVLQNAGKLGRVRCHMWVDTPYRSVGVGPTELMQAYQYKCDGCPAAGSARKKTATKSYFMASDARLLEIMKQQGLQCFASIMALQRGPRLGMQGRLYNLMERLVQSSGSIKGCCDFLKELHVTAHLQRQLAFYSFGNLLGWPISKKQLTVDDCFRKDTPAAAQGQLLLQLPALCRLQPCTWQLYCTWSVASLATPA
ncbi:hypothetical protein COO60DRAFT_1680229 [Scenedesmus sp. NREL 46B-D3]|nr:hypothetical protein COO60DRAFT_1680229 [Scenedesmus sp. NREL 46B-D3]